MGSASCEAVDRKAHLAGKTHSTRCARGASFGPVLVERCNAASDCFTTRPKGATHMIQSGVAVLEKGMPFPAGRALTCIIWVALNPSISP
jgi:hypothetical protein